MRNITKCLLMVLLAGSLAFAGCGKSAKPTVQGTTVAVDMPKFQQAFPSPTPEQQSNISKVQQSVRYGLYPDALAALDKLAGDAALSEAQKKAVNDMIEGVKQAIAKLPTAPPK